MINLCSAHKTSHKTNIFSKLNFYNMRSWNHVCIYGSKIQPLFGVSINGENLFKVHEFPIEEFKGSLNVLTNREVYVTFGKFTDLNIWNKTLSPEVIRDMSKSFKIETEPFLKWSDVDMDLKNFEEDDVNEENLLSDVPENLFVFKMKTFYEGIRICESIGGEIATPFENTLIEDWKNITTRNNLGRVFLSYSDEIKKNEFRNVYTGSF